LQYKDKLLKEIPSNTQSRSTGAADASKIRLGLLKTVRMQKGDAGATQSGFGSPIEEPVVLNLRLVAGETWPAHYP
jgi:hypothetical protein